MSSVTPLTVAISTRDRPQALARCLDGLFAGQSRPAEIVVVDQSRDHRSADVVGARRRSDIELVYIGHDASGLGASQNVAMERARYPVVAVIDDDCVADPSWLWVTSRAFTGPDAVDLLTGRVLPLGPETPGLYPVSSRTSTVRRYFTPDAMPWEVGSGNNFAVRREVFVRIGGNDVRLGPGSPGLGGVDMDLFYRLLRAGARACYDPDSVVFHERATRAARLGRRRPYGFGMGACCGLRYAEGDRVAVRMLFRWLMFRVGRLAGAARRVDRELVREELLVLTGTISGLVYGYRCRSGRFASRRDDGRRVMG